MLTNNKKFGLIGKDISYSFSKKYFTEKFAQDLYEDFSYENLITLEESPSSHKLTKKCQEGYKRTKNFECVKTNINGAMNLIDACIDKGIKRVVALSTDKASSPINLYGATKLASDKLFVAGNSYSGSHGTRFAVVRYGNVMGSRGSVIPFFMSIRDKGVLPITDERMTRFMISLEQGVELVWHAFDDMVGGEIYVKKIPSMKVTDLARVVAPECQQKVVGIRPGEKLHEQMIGVEDAHYTYDYREYYKILPAIHNWDKDAMRVKDGQKVPNGFVYSSDNNNEWMSDSQLKAWIDANLGKIGAI